MELAFLVYSFVFLILISFGILIERRKKLVSITDVYVLIPILVVSLVIGLRYDVGTDWRNYREFYEYVLTYGVSWDGMYNSIMEPFYYLLNGLIAFWNMPYQILFILIMTFHLYLLCKSFDLFLWLLPIGLFFYCTLVFAMSLNIHRQTLAFCIFLYAIKYYLKGNFLKYAGVIFVATFIHYSSLILFFVYLLRNKFFSFLDNRWICLSLYFSAFYLFNSFLAFIVPFLELHVENAKYLTSISVLGNMDMDVSSGLGILIYHFLDICIIWNSKRLSYVFSSVHFNLIFRLFLVGILLSNMFGNDVFLSRVPLALESLRFLMLSFWVYNLIRCKGTTFSYTCGISICLVCIGLFCMSILNGNSGCSPFQFSK